MLRKQHPMVLTLFRNQRLQPTDQNLHHFNDIY
jgi:hypothetical protein